MSDTTCPVHAHTLEQIEFPAKLPDYFLWSHKSNINQSQVAFSAGRFDEAEALFSAGLAINPQHAVLYNNRSACYLQKLMLREALLDADACITLDPLFYKGWLRKGKALFELKDLEGAVDAIQRGIWLEPTSTELLANMDAIVAALNEERRSSKFDPTAHTHQVARLQVHADEASGAAGDTNLELFLEKDDGAAPPLMQRSPAHHGDAPSLSYHEEMETIELEPQKLGEAAADTCENEDDNSDFLIAASPDSYNSDPGTIQFSAEWYAEATDTPQTSFHEVSLSDGTRNATPWATGLIGTAVPIDWNEGTEYCRVDQNNAVPMGADELVVHLVGTGQGIFALVILVNTDATFTVLVDIYQGISLLVSAAQLGRIDTGLLHVLYTQEMPADASREPVRPVALGSALVCRCEEKVGRCEKGVKESESWNKG